MYRDLNQRILCEECEDPNNEFIVESGLKSRGKNKKLAPRLSLGAGEVKILQPLHLPMKVIYP